MDSVAAHDEWKIQFLVYPNPTQVRGLLEQNLPFRFPCGKKCGHQILLQETLLGAISLVGAREIIE